MNQRRQKLTAQYYGLGQTQISYTNLQPLYGEILISSSQSKGGLQFISDFKGKQITNITGGNRKMFLFEELDENQNIVTALHSQAQDQIQYAGQLSLPIDQVVMSVQGTKILQIKSGKFHNIILTKQGAIYSYGKGQFGALGLGGAIFQAKPRIIRKLENRKIISVACGMFHSLALSNVGDVFSWGRGFEGQLGLLDSMETASSPQYIPHFFKYDHSKDVKKLKKNPINLIACGAYHSIAIDHSGSVYCWGEARVGQTGTGKKVKQPIPVKLQLSINGETKKAKVASGGFGHTLCLTQQGKLFAWGLNVKGQLGLCDLPEQIKSGADEINYTKAIFYPILITKSRTKQNLPPFISISCGFCNSFAIDKDGNAWSWGGGNIGFKDKFSQRGPSMLTEGTQNKKFSKVFANENAVVLFAPLNPLYFKPSLSPSKGDTQLTFFGIGFADTGNQHAKFKIKQFSIDVPLQYDQLTSTYFCKTPNFNPANLIYPCECDIYITLDKVRYYPYQKKLLLYSSNLAMESFQPKCGSAFGNSLMKIYMPLHPLIQDYVESISIGFKSNAKQITNTKYDDWICSEGHYSQQSITCKMPNIPLFTNQQPFYLIDVSLNGQQFTQHHQTFRFYSITQTALTPNQALQTGDIEVKITGKGLFDTPHKQLVLKLNFIFKQQQYKCQRNCQLKWNKAEKAFTFMMPSLNWIIGDHISTPQLLEQARKNQAYVVLYVAQNQFVQIGKFTFVVPPPPVEPEEDKKDSKKDAKKTAKK